MRAGFQESSLSATQHRFYAAEAVHSKYYLRSAKAYHIPEGIPTPLSSVKTVVKTFPAALLWTPVLATVMSILIRREHILTTGYTPSNKHDDLLKRGATISRCLYQKGTLELKV
jgi:hypothetical protein